MKKQEIYVLDMLRGPCAIVVLLYHYFIFFFAHQDFSASLIWVESPCLPEPFYLPFFLDLHFDIGHFAVSFFFLMSGFFILPSLRRYDSLRIFLIHKVFRLWPTYVVGFGTALLFIALFHWMGDSPFPFNFEHILAYFFWVRDLFHYSFIDGSVWTLEIQIKFYILAALIWTLGSKHFFDKIAIFTLVMSVLAYAYFDMIQDHESPAYYLTLVALKNLKYYLLILLGTCIYSLYKKEISWLKAIIYMVLLGGFFWSPLFYSPDISKMSGYTAGFFIFSYLILRHAQYRPAEGWVTRSFDWAAGISYPLYVGHVIPGYVMMFIAIEYGVSVYWGAWVAVVYSLAMATLVHRKVEIPFLKFNKKMVAHAQERNLLRKK